MDKETKHKILIVDDSRLNLAALNHILSSEYTVLTADSGTLAIEMAQENEPDLIVLDIIMPDMSGFDVLLHLKNSDATRDIPVIFITGLDNVEDEEKGFVLGAVDYITKPFNNAIVKVRIKTQLKIVEQMRTIEKLGMVDALTNIANRRSFDNHLKSEWQKAQMAQYPISLLMIDVDKFKAYNDTYGHPQGDVLLKHVAKVFEQSVHHQSDMAARIGGEEFAVILPNTNIQGALVVAEKVRKGVEELEISTLDNQITKVSVSIGVASVVPGTEDSAASFILNADNALYSAKERGRNQVCMLQEAYSQEQE